MLVISRSCAKVKVKGHGHRVKKHDFPQLYAVYLTCGLEVQGYKGQGQRSLGSRSKVKVTYTCKQNLISRTMHSAFHVEPIG